MGQESSRDTSVGTLLPKSWPPSRWAGCPVPGEDRRMSQLRPWLSCERPSPGAAGGCSGWRSIPGLQIFSVSFQGTQLSIWLAEKRQTYVKGGAVLREVGRIAVSLETTLTFPYQHSTKRQRGTIRGSSGSAPCRR